MPGVAFDLVRIVWTLLVLLLLAWVNGRYHRARADLSRARIDLATARSRQSELELELERARGAVHQRTRPSVLWAGPGGDA